MNMIYASPTSVTGTARALAVYKRLGIFGRVGGRGRAFSLIELLASIAVIAILATLLVPVIASIRLNAQKTKAIANLRQVAASVMLFANDHDGKAPAVAGIMENGAEKGWIYQLVEGGYLRDTISREGRVNEPRQSSLQQMYNPISWNARPGGNNRGGWGINDFVAYGGNMFRGTNIREMGRREPHSVIMIADASIKENGSFDWCLNPNLPLLPNTLTDGGANYAFCDGRVEWIRAQEPLQRNSMPERLNERIFF